jgi:kinesin family protein 4/21/27
VDERSGQRNVGIKIQEDPVRNEISLRGAVWQKVHSAQDIMNSLKAGALNRTTAATNMNQQSSRSHAIFTIHLKQSRVVPIVKIELEQVAYILFKIWISNVFSPGG